MTLNLPKTTLLFIVILIAVSLIVGSYAGYQITYSNYRQQTEPQIKTLTEANIQLTSAQERVSSASLNFILKETLS